MLSTRGSRVGTGFADLSRERFSRELSFRRASPPPLSLRTNTLRKGATSASKQILYSFVKRGENTNVHGKHTSSLRQLETYPSPASSAWGQRNTHLHQALQSAALGQLMTDHGVVYGLQSADDFPPEWVGYDHFSPLLCSVFCRFPKCGEIVGWHRKGEGKAGDERGD